MDEAEIKRLIGLVVDRTMRLDFSWDWPGGVALYGVCRAYETTGEARYIEAVKAWVDEYLELGIPSFNVNVCAMGHCLISLHEATGEDRYLELATRKAEYIEKEALRFGEGVLQHTVSSKNDFPGQAWADTLFMAAYFLLRMGLKTGNKAWVDDASSSGTGTRSSSRIPSPTSSTTATTTRAKTTCRASTGAGPTPGRPTRWPGPSASSTISTRCS
jgi:unsaturated rhamnogalacturonyl hydrolase